MGIFLNKTREQVKGKSNEAKFENQSTFFKTNNLKSLKHH